MTVGDFRVALRVGLPVSFPKCLPEIAVVRCEPHIALPHVGRDGKLCFLDQDGLVLDRRDWDGVVRDSLELARKTLTVATGERRGDEFLSEVVAHWRDLHKRTIRCVVDAGDIPRQIVAFYEKDELVAVANDQGSLAALNATRAASSYTNRVALYLPVDLVPDETFEPRQLLELAVLRRLVDSASGAKKVLARIARHKAVVVLGIHRPGADRALVAIETLGDGSEHPLISGQATLTAFSCDRGDRAFLAPRGGADASLSAARILLIGCGSVGGHIAIDLARAGVGSICLVDNDTFELANAYRHVCGMAYVGKPKTVGLASELRRLVPHIVVSEEKTRIEELLTRRDFKLQNFDLVISAIGSPTIEMHINQKIWAEQGPPMMSAWIEPLGLGQHVVLTNPSSGERGCLECLWTASSISPMHNRAAFAAPGGNYTADLSGCGSRHLPFADLDSAHVSLVVCQLALDILSKRNTGPALLSCKGDSRSFLDMGFETTERFKLTQAQLDADRSAFARHDCPICGAR
jgi:hypothetical protein